MTTTPKHTPREMRHRLALEQLESANAGNAFLSKQNDTLRAQVEELRKILTGALIVIEFDAKARGEEQYQSLLNSPSYKIATRAALAETEKK